MTTRELNSNVCNHRNIILKHTRSQETLTHQEPYDILQQFISHTRAPLRFAPITINSQRFERDSRKKNGILRSEKREL